MKTITVYLEDSEIDLLREAINITQQVYRQQGQPQRATDLLRLCNYFESMMIAKPIEGAAQQEAE